MDFYSLCCYEVKFVLVEIGDTVPKGTNFPEYNFFQVPKIMLSGDLLYMSFLLPEKVNQPALLNVVFVYI